jgi:uncharacterized GH25 family protein
LALFLICVSLPAQAHDLWLTAGAGRVEIRHGHPGDVSMPDKARLFDLAATSVGNKTASILDQLAVADATLSAPIPKAASMVSARYDGGFWVKTTQGYRNTNRRNLPDNVKSLWSQKFAKLLLSGEGATRPVGHRLELVPLSDPFRLKAGEPLRLRVDYAGKPLADADVEVSDGKTKTDTPRKAKADAQGIAIINLPAGEVLLTVTHSVPGSFPDLAAEDWMAAALSFVRAP